MTPWVLRLLIANIAAFLLAPPGSPQYHALMFVPMLVLQRPWTPLTYMFLHANLMHILFNMLGLYFFGPRLEQRIGSRDFLILYFVSGLSGAALSYVFAFNAAIIGASAAVFGVLYGYAHYWPDERIYLWFVLPVPARLLIVGLVAISLFSGFTGSGGGVAHFAHLGGFAGGFLYLKLRERRSGAFRRKATPGADSSAIDRLSGKAARDEKRWDSIDTSSLHEINRLEVDRIRKKIQDSGTGSLTPDERAFMNRMAG